MGGRGEEGRTGDHSVVNGDMEHISFSYSSDEDFLPRHMKTEDKVQPFNGSTGREAIAGRAVTSDLITDQERERKPLSLDQRRHRLCSITPRTPQATPIATIATPSSNVTTSPPGKELLRQPISPGLHADSSSDSDSHHSHSRYHHSLIPHSMTQHRSEEPSSHVTDSATGDSSSSSDDWQPAVNSSKKKKKKKRRRVLTSGGERKERKEGVGKREEKDKMRTKGKLKKPYNSTKLVKPLTPEAKDEHRQAERLKRESPDDEKVLEELKRKVLEDEQKNVIKLEEELRISSSSEEGEGEGEGEEVMLGQGNKVRSKRQLLSSDSDSEGTVRGLNDKKLDSWHGSLPRPAETKHITREVRDEVKKTLADCPPAKKLRLVDIDFTGGRMRLQKPPPVRHSPSKSRFHASRHSTGSGPDRKLSSVPANASNILKFSKPISKPLPRPHPPSKTPLSQGRKEDSLTHKDAVLAAKFPRKRQLIPAIPNRAHQTSKLKPSHRHS